MSEEKRTALIIDDNSANIAVIRESLQRLGFDVTAISHPNRIDGTLETMGRIDIVLVDIEMPTMDGYGIRKKLAESGVEAPIVAHTVHTDQLNKIRQSGFSGIISKPVDIDQLPETLNHILNGKTSWSS